MEFLRLPRSRSTAGRAAGHGEGCSLPALRRGAAAGVPEHRDRCARAAGKGIKTLKNAKKSSTYQGKTLDSLLGLLYNHQAVKCFCFTRRGCCGRSF